MTWDTIYADASARAIDPALVHGWEARLRAAGFDDTSLLHSFSFADLAEDLTKHRILQAYNMALGKGHTPDTKILTPTGWRPLGTLRVGDRVVGSDGRPTRITGVFPRGVLPVFNVTFSDGSSVRCDDDHLWAINTPNRRKYGSDLRVLPLREIRKNIRDKANNRQHFIPMVGAVQFEASQRLPIAPYLLGLLLGDGGMTGGYVKFSTSDPELIDAVRSLLPADVTPSFDSRYDWRLTGPNDGRHRSNPLTTALQGLGLMGKRSEEKSIPDAYKFASTADRLALLQGLLDTDGCARPDNHIEYSSSSPALAADVQFLVESLGGTARIGIHRTTHLPSYRLAVSIPDGFAPFRLARKARLYHGRPMNRPPVRSIESVEPAGSSQVICIAVDAADHLYVTEHFIVTHNTASAIVAAAVRGTKHTLIVVPNKLKIEWEREFRRLGFGDQYKVIEHISDLDRYECPTCGTPVTTFQRVRNALGHIVDVKRLCPVDGTRAVRHDNLARFNLISLRTLWTIPKDSPHAGRVVRISAAKNQWGQTVKPARARMKYTFAWCLRRRCEAVVLDEAYNIGNPDALQTKAIHLLKPRRRTLLTGTPVRGYPDNILSLLNWCLGAGTDLMPAYDPTKEASRRKFIDRFGTKIVKIREDGSTYEKYIPKIKNADQFQAMLAPVMRRRVNLEPEVAAAIHMPDFTIEPVQVEADAMLRDQYTQAVEDFAAWFAAAQAEAKRNDTVVPRMTVLAKLTYLSQLAACPQSLVTSFDTITSKQARILGLVRDAAARGLKTIVYSEWVGSARWYAEHADLADLEPVLITGSVSLTRGKKSGTSERERRMDTFRAGTSKLLVATTACIAEGFNIPEAAVVIFDSYPWTPAVQQQAWSRVLRPAQTADPVEIYMVGVSGTIDDFLLAVTSLKRVSIAEGIDYEEVEIDLDDVPDPYMYAHHLVDSTASISATYSALEWVQRLKVQSAEAQKRHTTMSVWRQRAQGRPTV